MYNIDVGINYSKLNELSKLGQELSGTEVPTSRPFIGKGAYTIESGIPAGWYKNVYEKSPTTLFPIRPEFVGHAKPEIVMGKKSGLDSVGIWAQRMGISVNEQKTLAVLAEVKLKSHD